MEEQEQELLDRADLLEPTIFPDDEHLAGEGLPQTPDELPDLDELPESEV